MYASTAGNENHPYPRYYFGSTAAIDQEIAKYEK